jgi:hypothetical protein
MLTSSCTPALRKLPCRAHAQKLAQSLPVLEATLPVCLLELTCPCPPPDVAPPTLALIGALLALPIAHLHQSLPRLYLPLEHAMLQIRDLIVCPSNAAYVASSAAYAPSRFTEVEVLSSLAVLELACPYSFLPL